ncbi:MAG: recombinase RecT [Prolixibacteraceae bacterium]|nr:recombinase RecT [Prolixibacteraceae bacterium]
MAQKTETTKAGENKNLPAKKSEQFKALEKNISDAVLTRINELEEVDAIDLPKDYSAANALRTGWLVLLETNDRSGKPVLESCTKPSIANALQKMILLGLNPVKKQCDFIAYGNKLSCSPSYQGNIALAKRFANIKTPIANIIYEGDEIKYAIGPQTGNRKIIEHVQSFENIDPNKIKGGYVTINFEDGSDPYVEIMTMAEIRQAWQQGATKGNSPAHKNFPQEMSKKSIINRACKSFINSSDDGALYNDDDFQEDGVKQASSRAISEKANQQQVNIDDIEDAQYDDVTQNEQPEPERKEGNRPEQTQEQAETKNQQDQSQANGNLPGF